MSERFLTYLVSLILLIFLLWATSGRAAESEIFGKYGIGLANSQGAKTVSLGVTDKLLAPLPWLVRQTEIGGYIDNRTGRSSAAFINLSYGLRVETAPVFAQVVWGVAGISSRDELLGGFFQFNNDVTFGVLDSAGFTVGLNYKHMSSAGIEQPNMGRDMVTVRIGLPLIW